MNSVVTNSVITDTRTIVTLLYLLADCIDSGIDIECTLAISGPQWVHDLARKVSAMSDGRIRVVRPHNNDSYSSDDDTPYRGMASFINAMYIGRKE